MYISSSYFQPREFPRSGSKAKDGEKKRKRERLKVGNNNGQLRIANATLGGARKAAWAKRRGLNDGNNNGQIRIANATSGGARKAAWAKKNNCRDLMFQFEICILNVSIRCIPTEHKKT